MNKRGGSSEHSHVVLLAIVGVVALVGLILAFSGEPSQEGGAPDITGAAVAPGGGRPLDETCTNIRTGRAQSIGSCGQYFGFQQTGLVNNCGPHNSQQVSNYCGFGCGINNDVSFTQDATFFAYISAEFAALGGDFDGSILAPIRNSGKTPVVLNFAKGDQLPGSVHDITGIDNDVIADNPTGSITFIESPDFSGFTLTSSQFETPGAVGQSVQITNDPGAGNPFQVTISDGTKFVAAIVIGLPAGQYTVTKQVNVACGDGDTSYFVADTFNIASGDAFPGGGGSID